MATLGNDDSIVALGYKREEVGKTLPESKVAYVWQMSLDGKKYVVELTNSVVSGKKKIFVNGEVVHEQQVFRSQNFQYTWPLGQHLISIVPFSYAGEITFELRINGLAFRSFAKGPTSGQPTLRQGVVSEQQARAQSQHNVGAQYQQPVRAQQLVVEDREYLDMQKKVAEIQQRRAQEASAAQVAQRNSSEGQRFLQETEKQALRKMDQLERDMDALEKATPAPKPRRQSRDQSKDQAQSMSPATGSNYAPPPAAAAAPRSAAPASSGQGFPNAGDFGDWPSSTSRASSGGGSFPPSADFGGFPGGFGDFGAPVNSAFPSGSPNAAGDPFAGAAWPAASNGWPTGPTAPWPTGRTGGYPTGMAPASACPALPDLISFDDASPNNSGVSKVQGTMVQPTKPAPPVPLADVAIKSTVAPVAPLRQHQPGVMDFDPLCTVQPQQQLQQQPPQFQQQPVMTTNVVRAQQPLQEQLQQRQQQPVMVATIVEPQQQSQQQQQQMPIVMASWAPPEAAPPSENFRGPSTRTWPQPMQQ